MFASPSGSTGDLGQLLTTFSIWGFQNHVNPSLKSVWVQTFNKELSRADIFFSVPLIPKVETDIYPYYLYVGQDFLAYPLKVLPFRDPGFIEGSLIESPFLLREGFVSWCCMCDPLNLKL